MLLDPVLTSFVGCYYRAILNDVSNLFWIDILQIYVLIHKVTLELCHVKLITCSKVSELRLREKFLTKNTILLVVFIDLCSIQLIDHITESLSTTDNYGIASVDFRTLKCMSSRMYYKVENNYTNNLIISL